MNRAQRRHLNKLRNTSKDPVDQAMIAMIDQIEARNPHPAAQGQEPTRTAAKTTDSQTYREKPVALGEVVAIYKAHGRPMRELGELIGCSDSSINQWLGADECPRSIERSCNLLLEQMHRASHAIYTVVCKTATERKRLEQALSLAGVEAIVTEMNW